MVSPAQRSLLVVLPNELLQYIAAFLPTDKDLVNFGSVCKEVNIRVLDPNALTWRLRFDQKYDVPRGRSSEELSLEYKTRAIVLRQQIDFEYLSSPQQDLWLRVIQTMAIEALSVPLDERGISKTLSQLKVTIQSVKFLSKPQNDNPSSLFYAVQLCLTALALDPEVGVSCHRDEYDIDGVYSYTNEPDGPFIRLENLDLSTLLNMRSFWQRHLLNSNEGTFHESFGRLAQTVKPQARNMDVSSPMSLSTSWLGYWSCVHPLPSSLDGLQRRQSCADLGSHWEKVEMMALEIESQSLEPFWPERCHQIIPQRDGAGINRRYFSGHQKTYGGVNDTSNPLFGFTESIEATYGGFCGWTRICFAIFKNAEESKQLVWSKKTSDWIHGYDAVILPGSQIMLGRWLDLKNTTGRGPFIFWDI